MLVKQKQIFSQIWSIFGPLKWRILLVLGLITLSQVFALAGPYIQGMVIDNIAQRKSIDQTYLLVVLTGCIWLLRDWITGFARERFEVKNLDFNIEEAASDQTIAKMLSLSIGQHNAEHSGIKQSVINRGQHSLTSLVAMFVYDICPTFSRSIIMTAAMCWLSYQLGLIILVTLLLYIAATFLINNIFKDDLKRLEKMWNQESKLRNEILYNISHVLVNAQEIKTRAEADAKYIETAAFGRELWLRFLIYAYSKGTIIIIARTLVMAVGIYSVYYGQYSLGSLVIFWSWSNNALDSLSNIGNLQRQIIRMWTSIKCYCEFLGIENNIKVPTNPVILNPIKGKIEFRNITYAYPSRMLISRDEYEDDSDKSLQINESHSKQPALKNVSFVIEPGETVAIVGESGSGKTTVSGLLLRADDPNSGQILIDEQDLRLIELYSYRSQVGLVEQHVPLFDRSIRYNILFGLSANEKVTNEELERIAKVSQISRFSHKLEKGFDTLIGERGIKLSGGERQRVGIARALIKNPAILIFDEATSSLDAAVEAEIRDAIREAARGRTTIIIAHRFSTIRYANRIIVMDDGEIVGQGTHQELYASCESYKRLVDHQIEKTEYESNAETR